MISNFDQIEILVTGVNVRNASMNGSINGNGTIGQRLMQNTWQGWQQNEGFFKGRFSVRYAAILDGWNDIIPIIKNLYILYGYIENVIV